jgi:hypothetical protein
MSRVNRVLCLQDGLEICIAGSERRWEIASYRLRSSSRDGEDSCLIPPGVTLTRKRFATIESLVAALRREIELHGEPLPAIGPWPKPPSALGPAPRAKRG